MASADTVSAGAGTAAPLPERWFTVPLALAVVLIGLEHSFDLDRALTRLVYDAQTHGFPLRPNFWLDVVMHHWAKHLVVTIGCLVGAALLLSYVLPALKNDRRTLLFLLLALSIAPLSVTVGKSLSARHCPWDIDEFGGFAPYTQLFERLPAGTPSGHCFPAGHASTGFALLAFYFAAYARGGQKAARLALGVGLGAGLLLGFGRVLQGAHFVSHVMWAGLLCWMVMVLLFAMLLSVRAIRADSLRA